jgi:N-acyl-D-aspartate/D-glutamate deacylase
VPTRLAADEERVALGRTLGEFNRGIIEILPKGAANPDERDLAHLLDVSVQSGRPVFFLGFDADARDFVARAGSQGARLVNLLRAIPNNPRFTLKKTTFFNNLDVWDVVLRLRTEDRIAALSDPERRAAMREASTKPQRRRPGVPGRLMQWKKIIVRTAKLEKNRALEGLTILAIAEETGTHVADVMLDLALEEGLDTEFQLLTRSAEEDARMAEMVLRGHALPSQSDAGAHLNTNFCTAGESTYVLAEWVRERQLMTLEDAVRHMTFRPASILGLRDRGLVREGLAADLMVFDLAGVGVKEDEIVNDGPNGVPRRVQGADGIPHVIVGGQAVMQDGKHTGAFPGRILKAPRRG